MIVFDASAAALALLNDGEARRALATATVAAPDLIDTEVTRAVRAQVRRGRVAPADGRRAVERWARLGVRRFPTLNLLPRIWELSDTVTASAAVYVALAEALGCELVTADARLAHAPGPACGITVVAR